MCATLRRLTFSFFLLAILPQVHAQQYTITDLGTLPGDTSSRGWAINSTGWIVGDSAPHAIYWTKNTGMQDLGCSGQSFAGAVNDKNRIVGYCGPTGNTTTAFVWTKSGGFQDLGTLSGGTSSGANGINDFNQVVGTSNYGPSPNDLHAFYWTKAGGMIDLGTLGGEFSLANAINNSSQVVGYSSFDTTTNSHGFIWTAAGGMIDLGTLPTGINSDASAINDVGMIVGNADNGKGNLRAVLWKNGKIHNLGLLSGSTYSFANAINNAGVIVGESGPKGTDASHAVIWNNNGNLRDLNNLICGATDFILLSARAINDSGQIAGYGMINGQTHAFLADPAESCE
jgi:probable HAF family extracellular repeat protein